MAVNYSYESLLNFVSYYNAGPYEMAFPAYQRVPDDFSSVNSWQYASPPKQLDVSVKLENKQLWDKFHSENNEMIITKSGRRMFPAVQLKLEKLESKSHYYVAIEFALASDRRHKYNGGAESGRSSVSSGPRGWTSAGPAEPQPALERRFYIHPESPAAGSHWMQHPVSFSKLKLTNNVLDHHSNVLLTSMHKYVPRIWIIKCDSHSSSLQDLFNNPLSTTIFPELEFIAVTAYQNENITKLKIDNNPFAKGFRETGQSSCKRKRQHLNDSASSTSNGNAGSESYLDEDECSDHSSDQESTSTTKRPCYGTESCSSGSPEPSQSLAPSPEPPILDVISVDREPEQQPAEPAPREQPRDAQPKLHRPWTDDAEEDSSPAVTLNAPSDVKAIQNYEAQLQKHADSRHNLEFYKKLQQYGYQSYVNPQLLYVILQDRMKLKHWEQQYAFAQQPSLAYMGYKG